MAKDEKMTTDDLLSLLQAHESEAVEHVTGPLRKARERAWSEYFQRPYGDEEEGWSGFVSSDVADTVEWILPDLLDLFLSNDKAVEFKPNVKHEAEGAKQATQGANHVFYEQNNGFLVLYTAFKDALMARNGAIHWRTETVRKRKTVGFKDATEVEIAAKVAATPGIEGDKYEIEEKSSRVEMMPGAPVAMGFDAATGRPMHAPGEPIEVKRSTGRIVYIVERKECRVEAFDPDTLLVQPDWTSPLLARCPYVGRLLQVTYSDLKQWDMLDPDDDEGKIKPDDLAGSMTPAGMQAYVRDRDRDQDSDTVKRNLQTEGADNDDESQTVGTLRIEWILADFDGDGIAERREVWRLDDRILSNEECDEVPIATGSPVLVQHRWDGLSMADLVGSLQLLRSEIMRGVINNAYASNNPRKLVLTDPETNAPFADVDDLLDGRVGGHIKVFRSDAVQMEPTEYVGNQMDPLLQRIDAMREERSGVTRQRMGMDPNAINTERTLGETQIMDQASKQRIKLIGRIMAETLVKPMMRGILHLLTSGDYDQLFFELRGQFYEYDPNEWDDGYRLKCNVGLGTGDREQKFATLRGVYTTQIQLAQSPLGTDQTEPIVGPDGQPVMGPDGKPAMRVTRKGMVTPKQIFNTLDQMTEFGGFSNSGEFFTDPGEAPMPQKPPEPPPYQIAVAQINAKAQADKELAEREFEERKLVNDAKAKQLQQNDQNQVQQANDERDARRERDRSAVDERIKAAEVAVAKYKVDADNQTRIVTTWMSNPGSALPPGYTIDPATGMPVGPDLLAGVMQAIQAIAIDSDAPTEVIYHPETGEPVGVMKNGRAKAITFDEMGRPVSLQ